MTDILFPPFLTIALTGTPGTGKTALSKRMEAEGYRVLHLTEFIREYQIPSERDEERACEIIDMDALEEAVFEYQQQVRQDFNRGYYSKGLTLADLHDSPSFLPVLIIESHLAHYLCDLAVVLRTHPHRLKKRLSTRGYSDQKVMENVLAESIDVILCDSFDYCRRVYEIETTDMEIEETVVAFKELIHALYADELKTYEGLMNQMQAFADEFALRETSPAELLTADLLSAYSGDDGAIVYSDGDEIGDYIEEKNPVLLKYVPGKNDWSDLIE